MKQFNNLTIVIFIILSFLALFFPFLSLPQGNLKIIGIATAAEPLRNDINKFGIHISETTDLDLAGQLVNSSGGDWGWVTIVIREDQMDFDKWQKFMDNCRIKHIIPLVRIATKLDGSNWAKPKIEDADKWVEFLNNLNWPVSDRYLIIYNEPNHAKEWGGELNPEEYARILSAFITKFKNKNHKFKILNAGLDLAAPNGPGTLEAFNYLSRMNFEVPGIFDMLDGWSSHSYPNHGFAGKPWENKKTSVRGYEFELNYLKSLGFKKELPVFITETGWPKSEPYYVEKKVGKKKKQVLVTGPYHNKEIVSQYLLYAFNNVWLKDSKIMAVTPFILNYPDNLFYAFSWITKEGVPYQQYTKIQSIPKEKNQPIQETNLKIVSILLPPFLPAETEYKGKIILKNTGESIWGEYGNTIAKAITDGNVFLSDLVLSGNQKIMPGEKTEMEFTLKSSGNAGEFLIQWEHSGQYKLKVFPSSIISQTRYTFWQKIILRIEGVFQRK